MKSPVKVTGFAKVNPDDLIKLDRKHTVKAWKEGQVQHPRYQQHLTNDERVEGWRIVMLSEHIITKHARNIAEGNLVWIENVGAIRDGHPKYFGVYKASPKIRGAGFSMAAGRGQVDNGFWKSYQFRLPADVLEKAEQIENPGLYASRSEWLRKFVLTGAEACRKPPYDTAEYGRVGNQGLTDKPDTIRVRSEQKQQIEQVRRPGERDYKLIQRLFSFGVEILGKTSLTVSHPGNKTDKAAQKSAKPIKTGAKKL